MFVDCRWGVPHLWKDVLNRHAAGPIHALVGGGDQIYNDAVWKTPPLLAWLDIPDHKVHLLSALISLPPVPARVRQSAC